MLLATLIKFKAVIVRYVRMLLSRTVITVIIIIIIIIITKISTGTAQTSAEASAASWQIKLT